MKLTTLEEDLRIHQKLEDEPNDVGGLTAQALKEKFDQAGVTIQKYLNETHLPEEEQAVEEALSKARIYADKKVKTLEQASMKTAVYDKKKRELDVYDYIDEKIAELKANRGKDIWFASGSCNVYAYGGACNPVTGFTELTDPDGMWSTTAKGFVVPEGGSMAMVGVQASGATRNPEACHARISVNGETRARRAGFMHTNGTWDRITYLVPLTVEEGDVITVASDTSTEDPTKTGGDIAVEQVTVMIFSE